MSTPPSPRGAPAPRLTYRCEAAAHTREYPVPFALGTYTAPTRRLALCWLRARAGDIADQLDPPFAQPLRHWLADQHQHEAALSTLANGRTFTHTVFDDEVLYLLAAEPIKITPSPAAHPYNLKGL